MCSVHPPASMSTADLGTHTWSCGRALGRCYLGARARASCLQEPGPVLERKSYKAGALELTGYVVRPCKVPASPCSFPTGRHLIVSPAEDSGDFLGPLGSPHSFCMTLSGRVTPHIHPLIVSHGPCFLGSTVWEALPGRLLLHKQVRRPPSAECLPDP